MRYLFAAVHAPDWLQLGVAKLERVFACGISGVDIRIAGQATSQPERELARRVAAAGLIVRCHAWAGARGPDGTSVADALLGAKQGGQLADNASALGVTDLASGNFERDVWRGTRGRANPKATDFIDAYITAFYEANRTCWLGDLGFADPDEHYTDADLDGDGVNDDEMPADFFQRFWRRGIMAYQDSAAAVRKKLAAGRRVGGPDIPLSWWGSVGRIAADGTVVGREGTTREIVRERASGLDEWVAYVGFGAIGQLLDGHAGHIALTTLVGEMV